MTHISPMNPRLRSFPSAQVPNSEQGKATRMNPLNAIDERVRMKNGHAILFLLFIFIALLLPRVSYAQDIEARLYANAPTGTNFIALTYKYSGGEIMINSAILEELHGTMHIAGAGYLYTFDLAGMTAKLDMLFPHTWMKASAKLSGADTSRT